MKKVYCFYLDGLLIAWTLYKPYAMEYKKMSSAKMKKEYMDKKYDLPIFMNRNKELMLSEIILTDEFNETYKIISTPHDDDEITNFIEITVSSLENLIQFIAYSDDNSYDIIYKIYDELVTGSCYNIDTLELYLYQQLKKGQLKKQ